MSADLPLPNGREIMETMDRFFEQRIAAGPSTEAPSESATDAAFAADPCPYTPIPSPPVPTNLCRFGKQASTFASHRANVKALLKLPQR